MAKGVLGAARPLPPSADIGPGGQSVGQAAQFCLVQASTAALILSVLLGSRGLFLLFAAFVGSFCIGR